MTIQKGRRFLAIGALAGLLLAAAPAAMAAGAGDLKTQAAAAIQQASTAVGPSVPQSASIPHRAALQHRKASRELAKAQRGYARGRYEYALKHAQAAQERAQGRHRHGRAK